MTGASGSTRRRSRAMVVSGSSYSHFADDPYSLACSVVILSLSPHRRSPHRTFIYRSPDARTRSRRVVSPSPAFCKDSGWSNYQYGRPSVHHHDDHTCSRRYTRNCERNHFFADIRNDSTFTLASRTPITKKIYLSCYPSCRMTLTCTQRIC